MGSMEKNGKKSSYVDYGKKLNIFDDWESTSEHFRVILDWIS